MLYSVRGKPHEKKLIGTVSKPRRCMMNSTSVLVDLSILVVAHRSKLGCNSLFLFGFYLEFSRNSVQTLSMSNYIILRLQNFLKKGYTYIRHKIVYLKNCYVVTLTVTILHIPGSPLPHQVAGPDRARGLRHRVLPHAGLLQQPPALLLAQGGLYRAALQVSPNISYL